MTKKLTYGGCSISLDGDTLSFDGIGIRARFDISGKPAIISLRDGVTDREWAEKPSPLFDLFGERLCAPVSAELYTDNRHGLAENTLCASLRYIFDGGELTVTLALYTSAPFIETGVKITRASNDGKRADVVFSLLTPDLHLAFKTVSLFDQSDINNTFARETSDIIYRGERREDGQLLFVSDYINGEELALIRLAPCRTGMQNLSQRPDFTLAAGKITAGGSGLPDEADGREYESYHIAIGVMPASKIRFAEAERLYRAFYRAGSLGEGRLYRMSNTWGDRGEGKNLCTPFVEAEISAARELGADAMQIDAEWAKGIMWEVDRDKFPDGLKEASSSCRENGVKLGLWFVPDGTDQYENWQRDADILVGYAKALGARYFKIDGTTLTSKLGEENYFRMTERIYTETNAAASVNYDITASKRGGFLLHREFGTLFVENRYTDWHNYFPHFTLKTIWSLCKYVPPRRMQLELLNPDRNRGNYDGDILAPANYSMDYLYAVTAFANPLIWMEMQNLSPEKQAALKAAIELFKPYDKIFFDSDITPLGEMPDGLSHTGLLARHGDEAYALLFRELSPEDSHTFEVGELENARLLFGGGENASVSVDNGRLYVKYTAKPSFMLVKLT